MDLVTVLSLLTGASWRIFQHGATKPVLSNGKARLTSLGVQMMTSVPITPAAAIMGQLTEATRWQSANILASAIITASARQHSVQQALDIARDIHFALFPAPNLAAYNEWAKTKHERLNKIHGQP